MIARGTTTMGRPSTLIRQLMAVAAAVALVGGLMLAAAARPAPVEATFGILSKFRITTIGAQTAGTPFTVTVEALDFFGLRVWGYTGANAVLSGLEASPNGTEPAHGSGSWSYGVGTYTGVTAVKATTSAAITIKDTARNISKTSNTFAVANAPLTLSFTAQPRDAEVGSGIVSSYATGAPVTVLVADEYGNPGFGLSVAMTAATSPGDVATSLGGTTTRTTGANGVASFSGLTIAATGGYDLTATSGSLTATSNPFQIVTDLAVCTGTSCSGTATFGANTNKQVTYSNVNTNELFDDVALTTSFIGDNAAVECLGGDAVFGQVTDVRVVGDGINEAQPSFLVALIVPKSTLQALGLTSRNADSFDVCLGATYLDGETETGWTGKATTDDPDPATQEGADGAWWGWVANCGSVGATDPCVTIKTKNAGQLQSALGLSKADFKKLGFSSSDLGIVVRKSWPWDGKMGLK